MPTPDNPLEASIAAYNRWREELAHAVTAYHDWLEANAQLDMGQSIRFFDLVETLNKGKLTVAVLGECARGKSALVNALLFPDHEGGLLPTAPAGATRCPTEILHDAKEEPGLRLLSMKSRFRQASMAQLRKSAVDWSKLPLDTASAPAMREALAAIAETKAMKAQEARLQGFMPMAAGGEGVAGDEDVVAVPAWRYAVLNIPHSLLANGLAILDLPGPEDIAADPELSLSTLPRADAILFVLAADKGIAGEDLDVWGRFAKPAPPPKIAVVNRIDLLDGWAQAGAEAEAAVRARVEAAAKVLSLDATRVIPVSAREALEGRAAKDGERVSRSGIASLEEFLVREIVPGRRRTLCRMISDEIGAQLASSRVSIARELEANEALVSELKGQAGKSKEVVTKLWQKISAEKAAYAAALAEYKVSSADLSKRREALMGMLDPVKLDAMLESSQKSLEGSWTTAGLQRGMRELAKLMSEDFERVFEASEGIKKLMQGVYDTFIGKFGFQPMVIPALDLEPHRDKLRQLMVDTDAFAKDPVNIIAMEKGFVVKKFHKTLIAQARALFSHAKVESERWLRAVTVPLETQMRDHKQQLQARLDNLTKINERSSGITGRLAELEKASADLARRRAMVEDLLARVSAEAGAPGAAPSQPSQPAAGEPAPAAEAAPAGPLISDDLMAGLTG